MIPFNHEKDDIYEACGITKEDLDLLMPDLEKPITGRTLRVICLLKVKTLLIKGIQIDPDAPEAVAQFNIMALVCDRRVSELVESLEKSILELYEELPLFIANAMLCDFLVYSQQIEANPL